MEKKCSNCKYFDENTSFCRRFPPTPVILTDTDDYNNYNSRNRKKHKITSKYPFIHRPDQDWCGEFEEAGEAEEANGNILLED